MKTDSLSETDAQKLGDKLIEVLQLKKKRNGRVDTIWGDKTPIGLARTVMRIIDEELS